MKLPTPRAILFDLDGTLADTAPDLAAAANRLRMAHQLPPLPYAQLRPMASAGARGLIGVAFNLMPDDAEYEALKTAFLDDYASALAVESKLFDGIDELLRQLDSQAIHWGIVTNKAARFTDALIPKIGLQRAACVISGDTTTHAKPHPAPLLEAARRLNLPPADCWYVGDDLRDIVASRAAGMPSIAAGWGYGGASEPASWNADALVATPQALQELVLACIQPRG